MYLIPSQPVGQFLSYLWIHLFFGRNIDFTNSPLCSTVDGILKDSKNNTIAGGQSKGACTIII